MAGASDALLAGYLSQIPSILLSTSGAFPAPSSLSACPLTNNGVCYGVSSSAGPTLNFNNEISTATIASASTLMAIMDSTGTAIEMPVSFAVNFSTIAGTYLMTSNNSSWPKGHLFRLVVSSSVTDINGITLAANVTYYFETPRDHTAMNRILARTDNNVQVQIPADAFHSDYFIAITTGIQNTGIQAAAAIEASCFADADSKLKSRSGLDRQVVKTAQIDAFNASGAAWETPLAAPASIYLPYTDSQNNGTVDGTTPLVRAKSLSVWRLEPDLCMWVKQDGSYVDQTSHHAVLKSNHFSVYSIVGQSDIDVSDVYPFPIPFRPNAGDAARYGSWSTGIRFTNLPSAGTIRIFTVTGALVRELPITANPQTWDVKNSGGQTVASGLYIWEVTAGATNNKKAGKLVIIR